MIKRKIINCFKLIINNIFLFIRINFIRLTTSNIVIEKNITLGKGIKIKITDNGKIIIKNNVSIENNVEITAQNAIIIIEENTFIGYGTQIIAKESISIGKDCLIASYCVIRDNNHNIKKNKIIRNQGHNTSPIILESDVWIGTHCTVTAGTTIYKGAVVGANSVVTKDVEGYSVVGGVPAKFIKKRV